MLEENITSKERYLFLDLLKVFAIYCVCFYHYNNLEIDFIKTPSLSIYLAYFVRGIASTGVPLFFMVNGALMLNRSYNLNKHIWKIVTITMLTCIWGVITLLTLMPITGDRYTLMEFVKALLNWKLYRINHLWFLQALVCLYILFPIIKETYDKENKQPLNYFFIVTFILTFGNVVLNNIANIGEWILDVNYIKSDINFFNNFNVFKGFYGYSIVYFILGGLVLNRIKGNMNKRPSIVVAFTLFLSFVGLFALGIIMSLSDGRIYDTVWYGYDTIMTLVMSVCIFILASKWRSKSNRLSLLIQTIGSNTLGIYFVHRHVGLLITPYFKLLSYSDNIVINLIYSAFIMFLALLIVLILRRVPVVKLLFRF